MKYYLVALFDQESYNGMEEIQKGICQKYKLYKNLPVLHITLETIEDPDLDKLYEVINDILRPYKRFKVQVSGAICFDPPYKSVNLKIESKGYINRIVRKINDALNLRGFKVRENIQDWDLHVSLANTNYAIKEWSSKEYMNACQFTKKRNFNGFPLIEKIELWKPINNKKEMIVKSFPLREF